MAYTDKIDTLSPDHLWDFSSDLTDTGDKNASVKTGTISYSTSSILADLENSLQVNDKVTQIEISDTTDMNTAANAICVRAGWFKFDANNYVSRCIFKEGGTTNNFLVLLGLDNLLHVQVEGAGASPTITEVIARKFLDKDRIYHICFVYDSSGTKDRFEVYVDGVSIYLASNGGDDMPSHSGDVGWGYSDSDLKIGDTEIRPQAKIDMLYRKWASWSLTVPTEAQIREIMVENDALPTDIITSDTEANMQTQVDALASVARINEILGVQVEAATSDVDLELDFSDIEFDSDTSIQIQYLGTATLSLIGAEAALYDAEKISVPNGGVVTLPLPIVSLTINSDTASSLIRYFEDDSQTATSTTGTSLVYTYPDTDPMDIEVLKRGYVPVNRQDVVPYNGDYDITLDFDEAYNSSHDLVITTDYTYNRATKVLAIVADQEALDVRSALADLIRTNSSYYNTPLLMDVIGGLVRVDLIDGMTCSDMTKWKGAGSEVYDAADSANPIEKWCAVKTVGSITGATTHYRQTSSGDSTALTLTNNVVNEALQYWSDPDHDGTPATDTSEYLLIKAFLAGSKQGRVDILAASGDTELRSTLYQVGLANVDHGYSGTDPGITADLTLVAGGTVGGKVFAYKIVDGGTNSGSDIANQLNYNAANNPNTVIAGGTGLRYFELPDMVIHNASAVETEYGYKEGATPTLVGFYVERSGADHPGFTRFQADDGTYYVKPVTANISITNLPNDGTQRLQIYNTTTTTEYYNDDPASTGYSDSYTDGVGISAGDSIRIRFTEINGSTSFKSFDTVVVATSDGFSVDASNFIETDTVYAANAVDGTTITKFTADFIDDEIDLAAASNFTASEAYAFFCSTLVTSQGIEEFWGGVTAIDSGNYRINQSAVNIYFDNTTTTNLRQTDSARIYRADEAYPVKSGGITTGGGGIDMNWQNVVYTVETGSGMTSGQEAKIDAIQSKVTPMTYTVANELDVNAKSMNDAEVLGDGTSSDLWRGE